MSGRTPMRARPSKSLGVRFVALILAGETLFALALGTGIGLYSARLATTERTRYLKDFGSALAASVVPLLADNDQARARDQLDLVRNAAARSHITCLRVIDGTGAIIVQSSDDPDCGNAAPRGGLFAAFTEPLAVSQPLVLNGAVVGALYAEFEPLGIRQALGSPFLLSLIVLFSVALVSAPWTAWLVLRRVIEPVQDITVAAQRLADGERGLKLGISGGDEIAVLAHSLEDLSRQLSHREARLTESMDAVERALSIEAAAKIEIEQLMKAKSEFVAVAAHEIRTPLAIMRLYAEMLANGELCELDDEAQSAAASMRSATSRLTWIVSDLQDAALLERGALRIKRDDLDMTKLVNAACVDAARLASAVGVEIACECEPDRLPFRGDRLRLRQVVDNLLSNAVKYSGTSRSVLVRCRADEKSITVEVEDEGIGIPEERRGDLFKLFGRIDSSDTRDTAGLGLGLAISAQIVEAHGGSIGFRQNEAGKGTIFSVVLPRNPDEGSGVDAVAVGERGKGTGGVSQ